MFHGAASFNQDLSDWKIDSAVDMGSMFSDAFRLVRGQIRSSTDMRSPARGCTPVRVWGPTGCGVGTHGRPVVWRRNERHPHGCLGVACGTDCRRAAYGHISTWKTGGVTNMEYLFSGNRFYNDDIAPHRRVGRLWRDNACSALVADQSAKPALSKT